MSLIEIQPVKRLQGEVTVSGDKSISHRGIILGAIANGTTRLKGFLDGADCRSTISCFRKMGVEIVQKGTDVTIFGKGQYGLQAPSEDLNVGNSGTTMRLVSGILAAMNFSSVLTGDESICKRPMKRIMDPLSAMGASISSRQDNGCAPLLIQGQKLHGITWHTPVASAQVKSCILLAGLYTDEPTTVIEPALSRDHTERMLQGFGASITTHETTSVIVPGSVLTGQNIYIPGDISSAAYFLAAAVIVPNSELLLKNININPTRSGILDVLKMMGAKFELLNIRMESGEEACDIVIRSSSLHGMTIGGDLIPRLIDELPVIAVLAAYAKGETVIRDAAELRVKESDRISLITENLIRMGADVTPTPDGLIVQGGKPLHGAKIRTAADHRIAMAFAVAGLAAEGTTDFDDPSCVQISFPSFWSLLESITS